jgi:ribosomal protein L16 Arg81 hydroxylase
MHDTILLDKVNSPSTRPALRVAEILNPVGVDEFLAEYWGKRSLHISGSVEKFANLLDRKQFAKISARADALQAYMANDDRTGHAAVVAIRPAQIKALYAAGFTICAKGLEKGAPALAALAQQVKKELHYAGTVDFRGYLSGHASGAPLHFDARHATTLQLEGSKIWRFAAVPSMQFPPRNATIEGKTAEYVKVDPQPRVRDLELDPPLVQMPPDLELMEVTLRPGDVLYLPPGTWHSAQAVGHSLAVNMAFNYAKQGTAIELLTDVLYTLLYNDPRWRVTPPVFTDEMPDGRMPESVTRFLSDRLEDARRVIQTLDASDPRVEEVWRRRVNTASSPA